LPAHDFHLPLLSLPRVLKTTAQTIPAPYAYLRAPANRVQRPDLRIGADLPIGRKVGIVWSGNPEHGNNAKRSCPFSFFVQLLQVPDLQLIGLQKGAAAADWQGVYAPTRMRDMAARCDDFGDTAMVIAQLDLVIAVDTAVAHLAGAMGKPVWLALPRVADWRWQLDRDDSPWYPSMRLFRQEQAGDWGGVFQRLINQLKLDGGTPSAPASSHGPA
jgi:Glycosyltransferase family 9 (heptosyltransferase)